MKGNLSPWNITPDKYPKNAGIESKLKYLLRYAILAPSGHNSQPWKFRIIKNQIEVIPDFTRKRQYVDPNNREIYISLGCAIGNIEEAGKFFGLESKLNFQKDKLKGIKSYLEFNETKEKNEGALIEAITQRMTSRAPFESRSIEPEDRQKLVQAAEEKGIAMSVLEDKESKEVVGGLIRESVQTWYRNKSMVDELQRWVADKNGLPIEALNLDDISEDLSYFWQDDAKKAETKGTKESELFSNSPAILIFSSEKDDKENWIRTGRSYERMALMATRLGIQNGFSTAITEIVEKRETLKKMLGDKYIPQLLLRIGYGKSGGHTPRRNLKEVLID